MYLLRSVKAGLNYAMVHFPAGVKWHHVFDAYVFFKDVLLYIACNQLRGVLFSFIRRLFTPVYTVAFFDVLERRLVTFTLKGKECAIISGMFISLKEDIERCLRQ